MLNSIWFTKEKKEETILLLGGFDGLHAGHRFLLSNAKRRGYPVGIMTIFGGKGSESLFTAEERRILFCESGADFVFELPFCEIKNLSPIEFIDLLKHEFFVHTFICGEDFRFGFQAKGTPDFLKDYGQVCVETYPLRIKNGKKISSSSIKDLLKKGDVENANALLESSFFLSGEVVKDRQVGRTIGFPTANVFYPKDKFPLKKGVYATETVIDGVSYKGITNYGARPTFRDDTIITETYLDGFSGDLYGKRIRISFQRFLREIQTFNDIEELKKQLTTDIRRVREND